MKRILGGIVILFSMILSAQQTERLDSLLIAGITARSNKDYATSLELLTEVRTVAEDNHWYKQQFLALNNIGANYYSMLDYGEALDYYLEAYTIALKHLDENEEMTVLNNIAILYSKEGEPEKAEAYFYKAYLMAKEHDDTIKTGLYAVNLGLSANELNKPDEALVYLEEAKEHLKGHANLILMVDIALAENYYKRGDLETAETIAKTVLPSLSAIEFTEEKISTLTVLSNVYQEKGELSTSIIYAEEALEVATNLDLKISMYEQLAKLYKAHGLMDAALVAKDSIIALNDTLSTIKNGRFFEANKVKFEIANYRRELQQSSAEQREERARLYTLLGFCALVIMLISWALRNSFIKNKQRKILHDRSQEIIALELEKEKSDNLVLEKQLHAKEAFLLLEQEKLKNEIETQNQKLAAKALQISSRNELLKDVINSLSSQTEISKNVFLTRKIKELKSLLKNDNEWESFLKHFEEVNQNFISELKRRHPELTANDIRYISYLYMDLTNKEISSLFNITAVASRKRKERISQKMGLSESLDLYRYLSGV
ncbi:tetratricopeptide repeat protein [Winogradskyella undariae]|uniref:tetratricopeptide repeat protein n=1 Tax=Winogradskyella undariae TaxID=1285465 RepID=UPI00156AAC02|nr:tetratricopeptide repeat protein [Winogradskyella undariae]NRR92289.1 tetratricopeptide repeat protein [Winogradskyella undariae]